MKTYRFIVTDAEPVHLQIDIQADDEKGARRVIDEIGIDELVTCPDDYDAEVTNLDEFHQPLYILVDNKVEEVMPITRRDWDKYEEVRQSGKTNMFDLDAVVRLSMYELTRPKIKYIIQNYDELKEKLNGV